MLRTPTIYLLKISFLLKSKLIFHHKSLCVLPSVHACVRRLAPIPVDESLIKVVTHVLGVTKMHLGLPH